MANRLLQLESKLGKARKRTREPAVTADPKPVRRARSRGPKPIERRPSEDAPIIPSGRRLLAREGRRAATARRMREPPVSPTLPVDFQIDDALVAVSSDPLAHWASALHLLAQWRRPKADAWSELLQRLGGDLVSRSKVSGSLDAEAWSQLKSGAGLIARPVASPSVEEVERWLRDYGPIWITGVGGTSHARAGRVLVGISGDGSREGTRLSFVDPAAPTVLEDVFTQFWKGMRGASEQSGSKRLEAVYWPLGARGTGDGIQAPAAAEPSEPPAPVPEPIEAPAVPASIDPAPGDPVARSMASPGVTAPGSAEEVVAKLALDGVPETEVRDFLGGFEAAGQAQALGGKAMSIHLPGGTVYEGWKARALALFFASALSPVPGMNLVAALAPEAILAICNRLKITVAIGPAAAGGLSQGVGFSAGIIFAPGNAKSPDGRIGFYGSRSSLKGVIASLSASLQLTVIDGGPEKFKGNAQGVHSTLDLFEGPSIGVIVLFDPSGNYLGTTGEVSLTLGALPIEVFAEKQKTATTLALMLGDISRPRAPEPPEPQRPTEPKPVDAVSPEPKDDVNTTDPPGAVKQPSTSLDPSDPVELKLRIYVPSAAVGLPVEGGELALAGDDRASSYDQGSDRMTLAADVRLAGSDAIPTGQVNDRHWADVVRYDAKDTTPVEGRPKWFRALTPGAQPTARKAHAKGEGVLDFEVLPYLEGARDGARSAQVKIRVAGANPFASELKPDANLDVFLVESEPGVVRSRVRGAHDGFPAYELYLNGELRYRHDPVEAKLGPAALLPPAELEADSGWRPAAHGAP